MATSSAVLECTLKPLECNTIDSAPVPLSSPRRHSFDSEALASPSLSYKDFTRGYTKARVTADPSGRRRDSLQPGTHRSPVSIHLSPAPTRLSVSRHRAASYSTPRPVSYSVNGVVPNYSMPLHRSGTSPPSQWASRTSFIEVESSPNSDMAQDSPIDRLPDLYPTAQGLPQASSQRLPGGLQGVPVEQEDGSPLSESPGTSTVPLAVTEGARAPSSQSSPFATTATAADNPRRPLPAGRSISSTKLPPNVPPKSDARRGSSTSHDSGLSLLEVEASQQRRSDESPPPPTSIAAAVVQGLSHPRPRQPASNRTPSLSQADSSSSRASSSVFTPAPSTVARSSRHSADDTDTAGTSVSEYNEREEGAADEEAAERFGRLPKHGLRGARIDRLELPSTTLGLGLGGLGIEGFGAGGIGDDDLQRGLEELARYAQSLPSPDPLVDGEGPAWQQLFDQDRAVVLKNIAVTEEAPISHSRSISRAESVSRVSSRSRDGAQSRQGDPSGLGSRSPSLGGPRGGEPTLEWQLSQPSLASTRPSRAPSVRRRRTTSTQERSESDLYLSVDSGPDDFTTDDEDGNSKTFLTVHDSRSPYELGYLTADSLADSPPAQWALDEEVLTSADPDRNVVDLSGKSLEGIVVGPDTTHLILSHSTTPHLLPDFLRRTLPTLAAGLLVLDLSHCELVDIPDVVGSCTALRELDIKRNPLAIATIPPFIASLTDLRVLVADSCGIASLPYPLPLRHLHTLSLRNNNLHSLPGWLSRLSELEVLLLDGNDFHWQWSNLVRPILLHSGTEHASLGVSPNPSQSTFATYSARSSLSTSLGSAGLGSHPDESAPSISSVTRAGVTPSAGVGPTEDIKRATSSPTIPFSEPAKALASSTSSTSSVFLAPPSPHSVPTPPPASAISLDIAEAPAQRYQRQHSDRPQTSPTLPEASKKWNKMFKKVSIRSPRPPQRPGALADESRSISQPGTQGEASTAEAKAGGGGSLFRNRVLSRPPQPTAATLPLAEKPWSSRRQSFLKLETVPSLDTLINGDASSGGSPTAVDRKGGLRAVMAYLRDLDDLSSGALSTSPAIHSLRSSPSHGNLQLSVEPNVGIRRVQSARRLPASRTRQRSDSNLNSDGSERLSPWSSVTQHEVPAPKLRADPIRRQAVVKEIVETEKTYVRGLQELCDIYIATSSVALGTGSGKKDPIIPAPEHRLVFGNVDAIREFHEKIFLPDLVTALQHSPDSDTEAERIATVFIRHVAFLKIYSSYVNSFDSALTRLQYWTTESTARPSPSIRSPPSANSPFDATASVLPNLSSSQRKRIKHFLKRARLNPAHSQISLESYLLLPVQRVPRYRMLLEALLACTPTDVTAPTLEPNPVIQEALELISEVATDMNERKRESEGRSQLLHWQNRIGLHYRSPLVQPHRSLIRQGNMTLLRTVKRTSTYIEAQPLSDSTLTKPQAGVVESLHTETSHQRLIALLCTDILVFVKQPKDPNDQTGPVELYTVTRLGGGAKNRPSPVTLFGADNMLRITCDSRAILYVQCARRTDAAQWQNAINLQASLQG